SQGLLPGFRLFHHQIPERFRCLTYPYVRIPFLCHFILLKLSPFVKPPPPAAPEGCFKSVPHHASKRATSAMSRDALWFWRVAAWFWRGVSRFWRGSS
ncbi:MAG: hypothetical protein LBD24_01400, partial [Spirochaetaceae bacterium]|nr:hypothetical protein [Spirochaetaceae bacterium]